ncbi:MAG: threonine aldolase family protein [Mycobacterium sp.]
MTADHHYILASDNWAGAHPEVLEALMAANRGEEASYGGDRYTTRLQDVIKSHFGSAATAFPVFNGTGANVVALQSMQPSWGGVICAQSAHINTDECGAPERVAGLKLLAAQTRDGKLTPADVRELAQNFGNEHHAQPSVVSITQSTELGTVYTPTEIAEISTMAHGLGMSVHLDGARLANAAAALGTSLSALTTDVGVDVISLGGTKNGMLFGEAVVVLNPERCAGVNYIRKYTMQLASKMRYISAQFIALLEDDLWLRSARHANQQAALLRNLVEDIPGVNVTQPTQANAVFAIVPTEVEKKLRQIASYQTWNPATGEVRWMCSHETDDDTVHGFVDALKAIMYTTHPV